MRVGVALLAGIGLTYRFTLLPALKPRADRAHSGPRLEAATPTPKQEVQPRAADLGQKDGG